VRLRRQGAEHRAAAGGKAASLLSFRLGFASALLHALERVDQLLRLQSHRRIGWHRPAQPNHR
jgi:hypothetical protein